MATFWFMACSQGISEFQIGVTQAHKQLQMLTETKNLKNDPLHLLPQLLSNCLLT